MIKWHPFVNKKNEKEGRKCMSIRIVVCLFLSIEEGGWDWQ